MSENPAAGRVARGAAMLDAVAPGWHARVRPDELDLASVQQCLLKQVFPRRPFGDSVAALGLTSRLVEHGLSPSAAERDEYGLIESAEVWWDELLEGWRAEIGRRMAVRPAVGPAASGTWNLSR